MNDDALAPRMNLPRKIGAALIVAISIAGVVLLAWHRAQPPQHCTTPMQALGSRCCGAGQRLEGQRCVGEPSACLDGMDVTAIGCRARTARVALAAGHLELGPSDWEAERFVETYSADVAAFAIDSHEVSEGDFAACVEARACAPAPDHGEPGLPQTMIDANGARAYCRWRGGDLPSRDQFILAAMGNEARRYPWGQTGAVCRRAAFGLADGPCAYGGSSPQLGGAHPDGATPDGIHDLAGNVAEWVRDGDGYQARGGSWRSVEAASLRSWSYERLAPQTTRDDLGFRCAYAASP